MKNGSEYVIKRGSTEKVSLLSLIVIITKIIFFLTSTEENNSGDQMISIFSTIQPIAIAFQGDNKCQIIKQGGRKKILDKIEKIGGQKLKKLMSKHSLTKEDIYAIWKLVTSYKLVFEGRYMRKLSHDLSD